MANQPADPQQMEPSAVTTELTQLRNNLQNNPSFQDANSALRFITRMEQSGYLMTQGGNRAQALDQLKTKLGTLFQATRKATYRSLSAENPGSQERGELAEQFAASTTALTLLGIDPQPVPAQVQGRAPNAQELAQMEKLGQARAKFMQDKYKYDYTQGGNDWSPNQPDAQQLSQNGLAKKAAFEQAGKSLQALTEIETQHKASYGNVDLQNNVDITTNDYVDFRGPNNVNQGNGWFREEEKRKQALYTAARNFSAPASNAESYNDFSLTNAKDIEYRDNIGALHQERVKMGSMSPSDVVMLPSGSGATNYRSRRRTALQTKLGELQDLDMSPEKRAQTIAKMGELNGIKARFKEFGIMNPQARMPGTTQIQPRQQDNQDPVLTNEQAPSKYNYFTQVLVKEHRDAVAAFQTIQAELDNVMAPIRQGNREPNEQEKAQIAGIQSRREQAFSSYAQAKSTLDSAGITGNDRFAGLTQNDRSVLANGSQAMQSIESYQQERRQELSGVHNPAAPQNDRDGLYDDFNQANTALLSLKAQPNPNQDLVNSTQIEVDKILDKMVERRNQAQEVGITVPNLPAAAQSRLLERSGIERAEQELTAHGSTYNTAKNAPTPDEAQLKLLRQEGRSKLTSVMDKRKELVKNGVDPLTVNSPLPPDTEYIVQGIRDEMTDQYGALRKARTDILAQEQIITQLETKENNGTITEPEKQSLASAKTRLKTLQSDLDTAFETVKTTQKSIKDTGLDQQLTIEGRNNGPNQNVTLNPNTVGLPQTGTNDRSLVDQAVGLGEERSKGKLADLALSLDSTQTALNSVGDNPRLATMKKEMEGQSDTQMKVLFTELQRQEKAGILTRDQFGQFNNLPGAGTASLSDPTQNANIQQTFQREAAKRRVAFGQEFGNNSQNLTDLNTNSTIITQNLGQNLDGDLPDAQGSSALRATVEGALTKRNKIINDAVRRQEDMKLMGVDVALPQGIQTLVDRRKQLEESLIKRAVEPDSVWVAKPDNEKQAYLDAKQEQANKDILAYKRLGGDVDHLRDLAQIGIAERKQREQQAQQVTGPTTQQVVGQTTQQVSGQTTQQVGDQTTQQVGDQSTNATTRKPRVILYSEQRMFGSTSGKHKIEKSYKKGRAARLKAYKDWKQKMVAAGNIVVNIDEQKSGKGGRKGFFAADLKKRALEEARFNNLHGADKEVYYQKRKDEFRAMESLDDLKAKGRLPADYDIEIHHPNKDMAMVVQNHTKGWQTGGQPASVKHQTGKDIAKQMAEAGSIPKDMQVKFDYHVNPSPNQREFDNGNDLAKQQAKTPQQAKPGPADPTKDLANILQQMSSGVQQPEQQQNTHWFLKFLMEYFGWGKQAGDRTAPTLDEQAFKLAGILAGNQDAQRQEQQQNYPSLNNPFQGDLKTEGQINKQIEASKRHIQQLEARKQQMAQQQQQRNQGQVTIDL